VLFRAAAAMCVGMFPLEARHRLLEALGGIAVY
jgi:hypothetical protein